VSDWLTSPVSQAVARYRAEWKLPPLRSPENSFSTLAQICQMPRVFDFPRERLPPTFHYVGPLRRDVSKEVHFPWERLDGRPLIYASLGTLQNRRLPIFRCFAEACQDLDVQLVVNHVGGLTPSEATSLPGDPLVVSYAPQHKLIGRADLTVTHAGLNTVLDSLAQGVPMVTLPITYEQPAIAKRVEWIGAGRSISLRRLNARRLGHLITDLLNNVSYRASARRIAEAIQTSGGVARAADVIESVIA
jgi:MGT family glycosyltransferase